ncbi:MAG TPA: SDR family oxidoreductase [Solirubrobacteraceae bacterium]|jgi:citronellol/citronellal dehydrogenase|nr:SDR family oxidoreductase [Solirubrobacteraceae bacterium]
MQYRSVFRANLFADQTIVITGGGTGIGRCIAHELASLGATVTILGRSTEKLQAVKAEIEDLYAARVSTHSCDIRDEATVKATIAAILEEHGRIDGLVNNAGGQYPQRVSDLSLKGFEAVIKTNLTGGFIVSQEVYNRWMADHGGSIVNMIADIWGGMPTMAHSGAARAGMLNLTESMACEWGRAGVRVNAVAPGWIASSGFDTYDETMQAFIRGLTGKVPLGRFGVEAEVSGAVAFLLSAAAGFISGSCIRVDGGVPNARHTWGAPFADPDAPPRSVPFDGFPQAIVPKALS